MVNVIFAPRGITINKLPEKKDKDAALVVSHMHLFIVSCGIDIVRADINTL